MSNFVTEIGHFLLVLAAMAALAQGVAVWPRLAALARPAARTHALGVIAAFACLLVAFVRADFSVQVVTDNVSSTLPLHYRVTALWSNHEGSMLLWALVTAAYTLLLTGSAGKSRLHLRALAVHGLIAAGFLFYTLLASNPFIRLDPPLPDGRGLNPLLQDPAVAIHPPLLYAGYLGFSVLFALAVAAMLEGIAARPFGTALRPWVLLAWMFQTAGIALGSWWAYYELGWGGWWFWDPVENVSLVPWLLGTALLHSTLATARRGIFTAWTLLLALIGFLASVLGTFLVRSGLLTSVHAFASDPDRGLVLLVLLSLMAGYSLYLYARRPVSEAGHHPFALLSRESGFLGNTVLLGTAAATVLLGTVYPLLLQVLDLPPISVGAPFYHRTIIPLAILLLALMTVAPALLWGKSRKAKALSLLQQAALWVLPVLALLVLYQPLLDVLSAVLMTLALLVLASVLPLLRKRQWAFALAHGGFAIALAGMVATEYWQQEKTVSLGVGDSAIVAGDVLTFKGSRMVEGSTYQAEQATVAISRDGTFVKTETVEKRFYPTHQMETTEIAMHHRPDGDIYIIPGGRTGTGGHWSFQIRYKPLVSFIWGGALVMVIAGGFAIMQTRHRRTTGSTVPALLPATIPASPPLRPATVAGSVILVLAGTGGWWYGVAGHKALPDAPWQESRSIALAQQDLEAHALRLLQQLQANPTDVTLWQEAGRAQTALGQYAKAEAAFRAAVLLEKENPALQVALAEVLTLQNKGQVPSEATRLFTAALEKDTSGAALYYLGLAALQAGNRQQARQYWKQLEATASHTAPWYPAFQAAYTRLNNER